MSTTSKSEHEFSIAETALEGGVIAILLFFLRAVQTGWEYYWIFYASVVVVMLLSVLRIAATQAENPRWRLVRTTIRWSSFLLQVAVLGILASVAVRITQNAVWLTSPVWVFTAISMCSILIIILVDQVFLGEYVGFWADTIREEMGEGVLGQMMRRMAELGEKMIEDGFDTDSNHDSQSPLEAIKLGIVMLVVLAVISIPIWYFSGDFFGSTTAAFAALIALLFIRDSIRYLYMNYGPAEFEELKTGLAFGFLILIVQILLVAEVLGYHIT